MSDNKIYQSIDQYPQYLNLRKAFLLKEYRGLESSEPELKHDEFSKTLLAHKFVIMKCKYPNDFRRHDYRGRIALVILTRYDSEFHNKSQNLVALLNKINSAQEIKSAENVDIFLITTHLLKKRTLKKVKEFKNFSFTNYSTARFAIEMPKANLCNRHIIVTDEELEKLDKKYYVRGGDNKHISETDTQVIWIGAFAGEVVKIIRPSMTAGIAVDYRVVTGVNTRKKNEEEDEDEEDEPEEKESE
jgi:DNA-directed RNA polymerase subunit H (RpoH/RPB5)